MLELITGLAIAMGAMALVVTVLVGTVEFLRAFLDSERRYVILHRSFGENIRSILS